MSDKNPRIQLRFALPLAEKVTKRANEIGCSNATVIAIILGDWVRKTERERSVSEWQK